MHAFRANRKVKHLVLKKLLVGGRRRNKSGMLRVATGDLLFRGYERRVLCHMLV